MSSSIKSNQHALQEQMEEPSIKRDFDNNQAVLELKYQNIPSDKDEDMDGQNSNQRFNPKIDTHNLFFKNEQVHLKENDINIELAQGHLLHQNKAKESENNYQSQFDRNNNHQIYDPSSNKESQKGPGFEKEDMIYQDSTKSQSQQQLKGKEITIIPCQQKQNEKQAREQLEQNKRDNMIMNHENFTKSQANQLSMSKCNMLIKIGMLFANLVTLALFGAMLYYEIKSTSYLSMNEVNIFFVIKSFKNPEFEDCFAYYKFEIDMILIIFIIVSLTCTTHKIVEWTQKLLFYVGFACSVITFARIERLLYFNEISQLKSSLLKFRDYEYTDQSNFNSVFENYYTLIKAYTYAIAGSAIVHLLGFAFEYPQQDSPLIPSDKKMNPFNTVPVYTESPEDLYCYQDGMMVE